MKDNYTIFLKIKKNLNIILYIIINDLKCYYKLIINFIL